MRPGSAFALKKFHLGLLFWQTAQEGQKLTERSEINADKNLLLLLTYHVFYPQCTAVFFKAAQSQDGYMSDRLDIDLKASTDTTLSILQWWWAVYTEMGAIFFSCQVWQKGFMLPPQGFPLQHQNGTLVATGFFMKNSSIVILQTQSHLQWSWVIYRQCQPIFSVFPICCTILFLPVGNSWEMLRQENTVCMMLLHMCWFTDLRGEGSGLWHPIVN